MKHPNLIGKIAPGLKKPKVATFWVNDDGRVREAL